MLFDPIKIEPHLSRGSFFNTKPSDWPDSERAVLLSRATDGFYLLLQSLDLPKDSLVILPAFNCIDVLAPLHALQLKPLFYRLKQSLEPDFSQMEMWIETLPVKVVVLVHHFGCKQDVKRTHEMCLKHNIVLLEDCAHLLELPDQMLHSYSDLHYKIYSPKKFFPVFDGGVLIVPAKESVDTQWVRKKPNFSLVRWLFWQVLMVFRVYTYPALLYKRSKKYFASKRSYQQTNCYQPYSITSYSRWFLSRQSIGELIAKRCENCKLLLQIIEKIPQIEPVFENKEDYVASYFLAVWCAARDKDYIVGRFRKAGLELSQWPILPAEIKDNPKFSRENRWAEKILGIPLHQDISQRELTRIVQKLNSPVTTG